MKNKAVPSPPLLVLGLVWVQHSEIYQHQRVLRHRALAPHPRAAPLQAEPRRKVPREHGALVGQRVEHRGPPSFCGDLRGELGALGGVESGAAEGAREGRRSSGGRGDGGQHGVGILTVM